MSLDSYHHGNLRSALVEEGLSLARDGAARGVTVRAAARRAGVSHAAAYRHFPSRRALLASVAAQAMNRLGNALNDAAKEGQPLERFAALAVAYVSWAAANPGVFRVAFSEELWDKGALPQLREASDRASRPVLDAAVDHLGPSAPEPEYRRLAVAAWAQAHGFAVLLLDRQLNQGELRVADGGGAALLQSVAVAVRILASGWPGGS